MQALLLIDIQNDYFRGGRLPLVGSKPAAQQAARLLAKFRAQGRPVIHIQHMATRPDATFFIPGTPGADIHASVAPQAGELVIVKHYPNSFRETTLLAQLQQRAVTQLLIAGMMTHMCIDTTTRAAADLGFACTLAHDACATRELSFDGHTVTAAQVQQAFIAALSGLFAQVRSTAEVLALLN